ncbi:hypothetical protein [Coprothermobacter platensis]|uniref:hypothetical protein n=1 Tax=Coprothermobacter platensis TaxID=108819 RepID=UPI00037A73C3|nr:hypothetical protein [Coprothermobacter platensis]
MNPRLFQYAALLFSQKKLLHSFAVLFTDMYFNKCRQEFTFLFQRKKSGNTTVEIMDNYSSGDPILVPDADKPNIDTRP